MPDLGYSTNGGYRARRRLRFGDAGLRNCESGYGFGDSKNERRWHLQPAGGRDGFLGTGSDTILSQIAAEALGIPVENIIVYSSDTDMTPFDVGAYASSTTYVSGNAVLDVAKVKASIRRAAAALFEIDEELVEVTDGCVKNLQNGKTLTFAELCTLCFYGANQHQICETGSYVGDELPIPFMATFIEVEIDLKTGKITPIERSASLIAAPPLIRRSRKGRSKGRLFKPWVPLCSKS